MTQPKPVRGGKDARIPICTKQIACDGENLNQLSAARGYCGKCKEAMEKKAKGPKPLKGSKIPKGHLR